MTLSCAAYARISTDKQSPSSIPDQLRKCREYAERQGWVIVQEFADHAISGVGSDRPGLKNLLRAAGSHPAQFSVLLIDDSSRLSRNNAAALQILEGLSAAGIRVISVSQGIDSDNEQADVLFAVHALVDSQYVKELGKKTHRGLEGLALRGLHTGGRAYGYDSVPSPGNDSHKQLVVNPAEAAILIRIFQMSANGIAIKKIAGILTAEGVKPPQPRAGRLACSTWHHVTIREMLSRQLYRGHKVWGKRKYRKGPGTNHRIAKLRPENEWSRKEIPELRIISEDLWEAVRRRFVLLRSAYETRGKGGGFLSRSATSPYLFSGILKCGVCGSNLIIFSGKKGRYQRYGCTGALNHGTCTNRLTERRETVEELLLGKLQTEVLRPDVIEYVLQEFARQLGARLDQSSGKLFAMRERKQKIEQELENLITTAAASGPSPAITRAIADREREISGITDTLLSNKPGSLDADMREMKNFVLKRLTDLPTILRRDVVLARAEMLQHVREIRMMPDLTGAKPHYTATGDWNLLGGIETEWTGSPWYVASPRNHSLSQTPFLR